MDSAEMGSPEMGKILREMYQVAEFLRNAGDTSAAEGLHKTLRGISEAQEKARRRRTRVREREQAKSRHQALKEGRKLGKQKWSMGGTWKPTGDDDFHFGSQGSRRIIARPSFQERFYDEIEAGSRYVTEITGFSPVSWRGKLDP